MENTDSTEIGLNAVIGAEKLCNYYLNCSFLKLSKFLGNLTEILATTFEYTITMS